MERMDRIMAQIAAQSRISGAVKTGVDDFDAHTDFLRRGELSLLGGRPGMGKTAIAAQITQNIARRGEKVAWFSADLSVRQLAQRLSAHDFPAEFHRNVLLEDRLFEVGELCRAITAEAAESSLIVIDFLQSLCLSPDRKPVCKDDAAESGSICRKLRETARDLGAAVLLLSTVSRRVDARKDHLPRPDDVPGWERVGCFADNVCLFYREEYYDDAREIYDRAYFRIAPSRDRCCFFSSRWDRLRLRLVPDANALSDEA